MAKSSSSTSSPSSAQSPVAPRCPEELPKQDLTSEGSTRAPPSQDADFLPEAQTHAPPVAAPAQSYGSPGAALPLLSIFFTLKGAIS